LLVERLGGNTLLPGRKYLIPLAYDILFGRAEIRVQMDARFG
jgi:hypothetical protein